MKKPKRSEVEKKPIKRKRRAILAGNREKDGFVSWWELTAKEHRLFQWAYLSSEAVSRRRELLENAGGISSVTWSQELENVCRLTALLQVLDDKIGLNCVHRSDHENTKRDAESLWWRLVSDIQRRVLSAMMKGDWKLIQFLSETGARTCPKGIRFSKYPQTTTLADCSESLEDSNLLNATILQCFFELVGSFRFDFLVTEGIRPQFDAATPRNVGLRRMIARLPDYLWPDSLPTKGRLRAELISRNRIDSVKENRRFTDSLRELGLNMLPEGKGGWDSIPKLDKSQLNDTARDLLEGYFNV
jgi:hypothetical protein